MKYGLVFETALTEAVAAMPNVPHELFMLACLDISGDPYGSKGFIVRTVGEVTKRAWAVGSIGFIVYHVDEGTGVVNLTSVLADMY